MLELYYHHITFSSTDPFQLISETFQSFGLAEKKKGGSETYQGSNTSSASSVAFGKLLYLSEPAFFLLGLFSP